MGLDPLIIDGRAINPLALIFSGPVYYKIITKKVPRLPNVKEISSAASEVITF